jgi:hypothetical protein
LTEPSEHFTLVAVAPSVKINSAPSRTTSGEVLHDLPSVYAPDPIFGLLYLPRFLAKCRKHLDGILPPSYQGNFTKGFDGLLCLHLDIEPGEMIEIVKTSANEADLYARLKDILPGDIHASAWNRQFVQLGLHGEGKTRLEEVKAQMGLVNRSDIVTFADLIEFDEGRLP